MTKNLIFFLLGTLISMLFCDYYYSRFIQANNNVISDMTKGNLNLYKNIYSDDALKIINANNKTVQHLLSSTISEENTKLAHMLMESSVFLNAITFQNFSTNDNVFSTMALFYKKTKDESGIESVIPLLVGECKKIKIAADCSSDHVLKIMTRI